AVELLRGQRKRAEGWADGGSNAYRNTIGSTIAVATKLGWKATKYRKILANDADHLQKMIFNELFENGENWITFGGQVYYRASTHYELQSDVALEGMVGDYLAKSEDFASKSSHNNITGCIQYLKMRTGTETPPNPDGYINCINGILEVKKGGHRRLIDHNDPEAESLMFLDEPVFSYDPNADRTEAERLLECLPDPRARSLFMRTMAFALNWEDAARTHGHGIALFSLGEGSNGKDTNTNILRRIFGESAVTSVDLNQFKKADDGQSFALANLGQARLNLPSETTVNFKIDNLKTFKATTTGNRIWVERKHENGYEIAPRITQMYPTNNEFIMNNAKEADERRYMAIKWPISYTSNPVKIEQHPELFRLSDKRFLGMGPDSEWLNTHVVPGYFNILLDYFEEVCAKGFDDLLEYSRSIIEEMGRGVNHVKEFIA
ncbi:MAG: DUF5906 domain-containing protein, partial [Vulcanococcus sp.]